MNQPICQTTEKQKVLCKRETNSGGNDASDVVRVEEEATMSCELRRHFHIKRRTKNGAEGFTQRAACFHFTPAWL